MESLQSLKQRLKSVQNIGTITKAMELVAATKMRKSQELALNSRPYAVTALRFLATVSGLENVKTPPLLEKRNVEKTAVVFVSSDKGLAGSFNGSVFREFEKFVKNENVVARKEKYIFIAVGEKSRGYFEKMKFPVTKKFTRVGDFTSPEETGPLADFLIEGFLAKKWDETLVFSTNFVTALTQKVSLSKIFPVDVENLKSVAESIVPKTGRFSELAKELPKSFSSKSPRDYLIEPSQDEVFETLLRHLIEMQVYHLVLEANASEHAARRAAMKNASDNAEELSDNLTLLYNKSRQAAITQEITEISAGVEALK